MYIWSHPLFVVEKTGWKSGEEVWGGHTGKAIKTTK